MAPTGTVQAEGTPAVIGGLHRRVLSDIQVLAQSVSGIGPSIGAAALVPLAYADAGGGAWLTVVIATVGILAVGICVSELAARHVSTGVLYTLVPKGLGPAGGLVTGTTMLLNTFVSGPFLALGVGMFLTQFLVSTGVTHGSLALTITIDILAVLAVTAISYFDIRISTRLMLGIELLSMAAITLLLLIVIVNHPGGVLDHSQLTLHGATAHGTLLAIVFLVLSYGSFEGSAALGVEARRPRRGVRVALLGSVVVAGLFFTFNAYAQVLGFQGTGLSISSQSSPLNSLAHYYGVSWLGDIVLLGVTLSFFGALNAWLNYIPRMVFAMGADRVLPAALAKAHPRTGSPYVAVLSWSVVWLAVLVFIFAAGTNQTNAFNDFGSLSGYCFTLVYLLVAVAAPIYFFRTGKPNLLVTVAGIVGALVMLVEFYYLFNPLPTNPLDIFVYVFVGLVVLTLVGAAVARKVAPEWLRQVGRTEEPALDAPLSGSRQSS